MVLQLLDSGDETMLKIRQKSLEQKLTPTLHATALLRAEIDRQQDALQQDRRDLEALKKNAAAEARLRRKKGKKVRSYFLLRLQLGIEDSLLISLLATRIITKSSCGKGH